MYLPIRLPISISTHHLNTPPQFRNPNPRISTHNLNTHTSLHRPNSRICISPCTNPSCPRSRSSLPHLSFSQANYGTFQRPLVADLCKPGGGGGAVQCGAVPLEGWRADLRERKGRWRGTLGGRTDEGLCDVGGCCGALIGVSLFFVGGSRCPPCTSLVLVGARYSLLELAIPRWSLALLDYSPALLVHEQDMSKTRLAPRASRAGQGGGSTAT